jgi:hypothetical protein
MHVTDLVAAGLLLLGAVLSLTVLPRRSVPAAADRLDYQTAPTGT